MAAEFSYWELLKTYWDSINLYDGPDIFLDEFKRIPAHIQHLAAAHWTQSEVINGGFSQYFYNSTGVLAPEAILAFHAIGMPETAIAVETAMETLGAPYPRDRAARHDRLLALPDTRMTENDYGTFYCAGDVFSDLDERFYQLLDQEAGGFDVAANLYASKLINEESK